MSSAESNPGAADGAGISAESNTEPPKPHPPPADGIPTATDKFPPFDIESDIPPQMYGEPWQYLVDNYGAPIDCELNPNPGAADGAAISAESNPGAADGAGISAESNTEPPKFRYVTCGTDRCGRSEHWRRMYSKRVYGGHEDDEYTFSHQCWECILGENPALRTEGKAREHIANAMQPRRKKRAKEHKKAKAAVEKHFPCVNEYHQVRSLTNEEFKTRIMSNNIVRFLQLKCTQKDQHTDNVAKHDQICEEMGQATSEEAVKEILAKMTALEGLFAKSERPLAFSGWDDETQARFQAACDYCDIMWEVKNTSGVVVAVFAVYYICAHGGQQPGGDCLTLILSNDWSKKFDDPLATGQKWKCNICGVKYKTKFGMLAEVFTRDEFLYAKMPAKDFDAKDLQAMLKESECTAEQKKSPENLYASLKRHPPHTGKHIRQAETTDFFGGGQPVTTGVYKIDKEWFGKLPLLDWPDFFVYGDKDQQGYKLKGGRRPVATTDALKGLVSHAAPFVQ